MREFAFINGLTNPSFERMKKARRNSPAFTLLELLTVLAIIGILAFAAASTIKFTNPGGIDSGIVQITDLLELSRNFAITHKTYVWVAFQSGVALTGTPQVQMGAVYSLDGTGTNTNQTNLGELSRVRTVAQIKLIPWSSLKSTTTSLFLVPLPTVTPTPVSVASNSSGLACVIANTSFSGKTTITFTPRGQAMRSGSVGPAEADTTGYDSYIDVSFQQTKGNTATVAEDGSVIVDGSSGALTIIRHT